MFGECIIAVTNSKDNIDGIGLDLLSGTVVATALRINSQMPLEYDYNSPEECSEPKVSTLRRCLLLNKYNLDKYMMVSEYQSPKILAHCWCAIFL